MRYFQDTLLLLLYGVFAVQYVNADIVFVLSFLCAISLCCVGYCIEAVKIRLILCILYLISALFFPPFFFFFPMAAYLLFQDGQYVPALCGFVFYLYHFYTNAESLPFFFGLFGFLLAYLLQIHTRQYLRLDYDYHRTQDDSRERNFLLSEKNKVLLEQQNAEIYAATLKERNRIAREIHDNVGHVLSRSILLLGAVKAVNKEDSLNPLLTNLDDSLNSAMNSIRSSVHDLHDESINLKDVVQNLIDEFEFCPVDFQYDMEPYVPKDIKYCFISITKEALSNVIKHSNADQVSVTMREHPALYQLRIEDNGTIPFPSPPDAQASGYDLPGRHFDPGIGLVNMQDRVRALRGTFQMKTDCGFQIFITIPKER